MIILYVTDVSDFGAKVEIAFEYKGIAYERRLPPGGTYRSDAYRAIVPAATIPAIDHDGFILSETDAILEYVEDTHPGPSLLPGGAKERALARCVSRLHDFRIEPCVRAFFPLLGTADHGSLAASVSALRNAIRNLEPLVEPAPFASGAAFGLGDCAWPPTFLLADSIVEALGEPAIAYGEKLDGWRAALDGVPAVRKVMARYRVAIEAWLLSKAKTAL